MKNVSYFFWGICIYYSSCRFWRALRSFDQTDRAKFLQFVTGSSKVPLQVWAHISILSSPNGNLRDIPHFIFCRASAPSREWTAHRSSRYTGTIGKKMLKALLKDPKCFHTDFYQVDWSTSRCPHLLQSAGLACLRGQNFAQTVFSHLMLIFCLQTYDKLRTYLLKAIQECSEGFGFA